MSGTEALILCGIIILSLSVLAMISPRFFRLALRLVFNVLFGMLALSIIAEIWPVFPSASIYGPCSSVCSWVFQA